MMALSSILSLSVKQFSKLTYTPYHRALKRCLQAQGQLTVVVVGANDGKINDPVYDFAKRHRDRTQMILIEPQSDLIEPLTDNWANHPNTHIIQGAVGAPGCLRLYTVDPGIWHKTQPLYAKAWPPYRAPSGIASTQKARVLDWIARYVDHPQDHLIETTVEAKPLADWLSSIQHATIDVLQVDTEGVDDEVIYCSGIEHFKPWVIYFESKNLPRAKLNALRGYLQSHHYRLQRILGNTLAWRVI